MCRRRLRRGMNFPAPARALDLGDAGGFDADAAFAKRPQKCLRRHEPPVRHCRTPGEVADAMKKTRNGVNINCLSHSAKTTAGRPPRRRHGRTWTSWCGCRKTAIGQAGRQPMADTSPPAKKKLICRWRGHWDALCRRKREVCLPGAGGHGKWPGCGLLRLAAQCGCVANPQNGAMLESRGVVMGKTRNT